MSSTSIITEISADPDSDFSYPIVHYDYGLFGKNDLSSLETKIYLNSLKERVVVSSDNIRKYKGYFSLEGGKWNQNFLLIKNKRSNKARIIRTTKCLMGSVTKKSRGTSLEETLIETSPQNDKDLTRVFGSKKQKRISYLHEKLNTSIKNDQELAKVAANVSVNLGDNNDAIEEGEENILRLLPPCNRKATSVEEVYLEADLIPEREMKALRETANYLLKNQTEYPKGSHLSSLIASLKDLNIDVTGDKMVYLLFIDSLIKYLEASAGELKSKKILGQICPFSTSLASRILKEFTTVTGQTRARPLFFKDKAVCYIMVLLCLAGNYLVSMNTITSCIKKMSNKKLMQLAKVVGLVPTKFGSRLLTLKVPLPQLNVAPSKRKSSSGRK